MSDLLTRVPRVLVLPAIPIVAFFVAVGIGFGTASDETPVLPTPTEALGVIITSLPTPTATASPVPPPVATATATPVPDRLDCDEIEGTDYRSDTERDWYTENCTATVAAEDEPVSSSGGGVSVAEPAAPSTAQTPIGDTLVIPSIGVNADVYRAPIGEDGAMPDPVGVFNVVWYDFGIFPGLGGYVSPDGSTNVTIAGHVDSSVYGAAVFYYLSNLAVGDEIEYYTSAGELYRYVVTGMGDYLPGDNWAGVVSSAYSDLTLITCNGTFDLAVHEYTHRRVVFADLVGVEG